MLLQWCKEKKNWTITDSSRFSFLTSRGYFLYKMRLYVEYLNIEDNEEYVSNMFLFKRKLRFFAQIIFLHVWLIFWDFLF